ncbi:PBSX family phage terminase large subunit [Hominenteromicrobium sp.]|uniref:PBSX family phage terminase large subunit n=1 Tax=Hominenteromicrobium sp. TaxID=3073581 RepID=UPI003AB6E7F9
MYYDRLKSRVRASNIAKQQQIEARALLDNIDVKQHIAPCYLPLHEDIKSGQHRFYNLPGGRGSCKSSFVSLEIVDGIQSDPTGQSNAIVFRKVAGTMRDSVFSQIAWAIDMLGVSHLWKATVSPMMYEYRPTGAQILFRGLDDASKLKSIKPRRGTFRFCWFEEFSEISGPNLARNVLQSVMRGQGTNPQVFRSFNPPISKANWANQFVAEPDAQGITFHTTYKDIPAEWLGESFLYEAERLRDVNPKAYEHEYLGVPTGTGGEVFPNLEIREITDKEIERMGYFYQGLDFGFAVDPAAFLRVSYDRKSDTVFFVDEIYKRHLSNKQLAEEIKKRRYDRGGGEYHSPILGGVYEEKQLITADCAEPKSISDLQAEDLKCIPCHKEPGCVAYRVKWLQHRRIVIDPKRTPEAYREFVNYSYATDKDGNFLSELPDKDNHTIDACAYALDRLIYRRGVSA